MSSETSEVYVWQWLPGHIEPVPVGVLTPGRSGMRFSYGTRYLQRSDRVSLSPTLPLDDTTFDPTGQMGLPSAIRDAAPDAWGRRVILNQLTGSRGSNAETADLSERTYLLESESDRIGAIDFQESPSEYVPRVASLDLNDLREVAELVSAGEPLPDTLHETILSGTGIGGARPKALTKLDGRPSLVKFSVSTDVFPTIEAEAIASNLAGRAGIDTAPVSSLRIGGRYALISERFDREPDGSRRAIISGLTLTGRDEMESRYSSYPELLEKVQDLSDSPDQVGPELFARIAFNMMISNSDDHLRNHAAFWDGTTLTLTPAYDLAPGARREGAEATQTLAYGNQQEKLANLAALGRLAPLYGLSRAEGFERIDAIREVIETQFEDAADEMEVAGAIRMTVSTSFLHDTVVRDLPTPISLPTVSRTHAKDPRS